MKKENVTIFCRGYHKQNKPKSDIEEEKNHSNTKNSQVSIATISNLTWSLISVSCPVLILLSTRAGSGTGIFKHTNKIMKQIIKYLEQFQWKQST